MMNKRLTPRKVTRRDFLKFGGGGAVAALFGTALPAAAARPAGRLAAPPAQAGVNTLRLVATDGNISLPGRGAPGVADPVGLGFTETYVFGFRPVMASEVGGDPISAPIDDLDIYKGNVQLPAPIIAVGEDEILYLTLTNIGLVGRPDLDDSHTVHWHGFRNPTALFDGVPEVSIAVPVARDFRYYYRPRTPGTFMYHCHFEDSEHVQMGMDGIVFVRPAQDGASFEYPAASGKFYTRFAYNDGDGSTGFDREFTLLLNEVDVRPHDLLIAVQEFVWSDYKPQWWIINGRSYPDTVLPGSAMASQPVSSLIQVNGSGGTPATTERVLLRFASLGYEQHAMVLPGIAMRVVGEDATLLRGSGGADLTYLTNTVYIGPGEARDVVFDAPGYNAAAAQPADATGSPYNRYYLKNRSYHKQTNGGLPGLGGMVTEVRVYPSGTLAAQTSPNQTFPA